jgi:hypothetical protein
MKLSDEFSFPNATSIYRVSAARCASPNQPNPEPFLNEKHPRIHSLAYAEWRLQPPAVR